MDINENIQIRTSKSMGRGYYALNDLPANLTLIKVHQTHTISFNKLIEHNFYHNIHGSTDDNRLQFAYFLASVQQSIQNTIYDDIIVRNYIKNLPTSYNNLVCWSDQELKMLQNSTLEKKIIEKKRKINQNYEIIRKIVGQCQPKYNIKSFHLNNEDDSSSQQELQIQKTISTESILFQPSQLREKQRRRRGRTPKLRTIDVKTTKSNDIKLDPPNVDLQKVIYFYAAIQSRNIYHSSMFDPYSKVGSIVPQVEMLNYSSNPQCQVLNEKRFFVVKTTRRVLQNQQLFVNYGCSKIQQFLQKYGFVDPNQASDTQNTRQIIAAKYKMLSKQTNKQIVEQ